MRDVAQGKKEIFEEVDLESVAQPFPDRFDGRSARVRAFLLYLASLKPQSVKGRGDLPTEVLLSELGPGALAFLVKKCQDPELTSSPANRVFADRDHRGPVARVLQSSVQEGSENIDKFFASHGFPPAAMAPLAEGKWEEAIRSRRDFLIEGEREFMIERSVTCPAERTASIVRDSDVSEDE